MAEKMKGKKKNAAKAGKLKGRPHLTKNQATERNLMMRPNKDVYNRADEAMDRMVKNHGIPRTSMTMK